MNRYKMRLVKKSDLKAYYQIGSDDDVTKYLTWRTFKTRKDAKEQFREMYFNKYILSIGYAITSASDDKMIGIIEFHTIDLEEKSAHIGYLLQKDYWNKGIMSWALGEILKIGFNELNYQKVIITTIKENIASQKVVNHYPFTLIKTTKFGLYQEKSNTYHDLYEYILERKDFYGTKTQGDI